jgi:hypothetical protein
MITKIYDNRKFQDCDVCDFVIEEAHDKIDIIGSGKILSYGTNEKIFDVLNFAKNIFKKCVVYIYDLNSKPLK